MTTSNGHGRRFTTKPKRPHTSRAPVATQRSSETDIIKATDERVACRGWGPTLRVALLRCSQGMADRLAVSHTECSGHGRVRTSAGLTGAALAVYAKTRGWL
jgi:hypothetical protein